MSFSMAAFKIFSLSLFLSNLIMIYLSVVFFMFMALEFVEFLGLRVYRFLSFWWLFLQIFFLGILFRDSNHTCISWPQLTDALLTGGGGRRFFFLLCALIVDYFCWYVFKFTDLFFCNVWRSVIPTLCIFYLMRCSFDEVWFRSFLSPLSLLFELVEYS